MKRIIEIIRKPKVERAIKTFIEAFCSYIAVNIMTSNLDSKSAVYALLSGAFGSAISIALNIQK